MGTTLYKNADWIITMNEKREKIRHGDLLISGKEILDVGTDLEKKYEGTLKIDHVVEAEGTVILPGFVNVHHHTWQSLIRNIQATRGLKLEPWLTVMYEIYKDLNTLVLVFILVWEICLKLDVRHPMIFGIRILWE